jgi:hypothetical protein
MGLIRSINPNSTENKNYERVQSFRQKRTMRSSNQFQMARQLGYLDKSKT